jgi:hypothetical protein
MNPVITISKNELKAHPDSEKRMTEFVEKVSDFNDLHVYSPPNSMQLIEFICFLKDSAILFDFFSNEKEMKAALSRNSKAK